MLIAGAEPAQTVIAITGGLLALLALIVGSYFIVKARKGTADDNEATKTVTMMTGQIAALTSAQELARSENSKQAAEISHLHELLVEKDKAFDTLKATTSADIKRLEGLISQQVAVTEFRDETREWLGVIADKLGIAPSERPHPAIHGL